MEICFIFPDGREIRPVKKPTRMELLRDLDTPADGLELRYDALQPVFGEVPVGVRVMQGETLIFEGIVDTHTVEAEKGVRTERFLCRSTAAKLLDNEAQPGVLNRPSVRLMDKLYLAPFGLRADDRLAGFAAGRLSVEQKTRCWSVLQRFAEQLLGTDIFCKCDGTVCFSARAGKLLHLPTAVRLRLTRNPYARISRVVVQNARTGAYNTVYDNENARGVQRIRYLSARAETAPQAVLSAGEQEALLVTAVFAGYIDADPGDRADLTAYDPTLPQLQVIAVQYVQNGENGETVLELKTLTGGKENGDVEFKTDSRRTA